MLELEHYAVIAIFMMTMLTMGYGLSNEKYEERRTAGSFMTLGGIIAGLVIAGGVSYELQKRIRKWNLDRRLDELEIKEKELEVKKREKEFRKKAEVNEHINSQDERHEKNSDFGTPVSENTREAQNKKSQPPQSTDNIPQKEESEEGPTLKTGMPVPENLDKMRKAEQQTERNVCVTRMELDKILKCLLALYKNPDHYFENISTATRIICNLEEGKRSGSAEQSVSASMKELKHYGLVDITTKKEYDGMKKQKINEYRIADFGIKMIDKAIGDDVSNWSDFVEKYKIELRDKK